MGGGEVYRKRREWRQQHHCCAATQGLGAPGRGLCVLLRGQGKGAVGASHPNLLTSCQWAAAGRIIGDCWYLCCAPSGCHTRVDEQSWGLNTGPCGVRSGTLTSMHPVCSVRCH
jgi:hypothetical protein